MCYQLSFDWTGVGDEQRNSAQKGVHLVQSQQECPWFKSP